MTDEHEDVTDLIRKVFDEAGGIDVPQGPHYGELLALIVDELTHQLLVSEVNLRAEEAAQIAGSIALEVDFAFSLSPRHFRPFGDSSG